MILLLFLITVLFVLYCGGESLASIARHAGTVTGHYPLGLMLSNQVYSINRLTGFMIAPLLGLYVDGGGSQQMLKNFAMVGCFGSMLLLMLTLRIWPVLLKFCARLLQGVEKHGFTLAALGYPAGHKDCNESDLGFRSRKRDVAIILGQSFATSLAMPAAFILNILAIRYPHFQATLVQSATAISGVGNLVLNFYIFPKTALAETRGNADHIYYSAMIGKILGIGIFSTCIIAIL
ncbi:hypothetical protein [Sneathiella sp.]|uniref:hypothetical protein n=1 Tax=Sneathiella sp. TaxID=1964365 RepID=UPI0035635635